METSASKPSTTVHRAVASPEGGTYICIVYVLVACACVLKAFLSFGNQKIQFQDFFDALIRQILWLKFKD